MEGDSLGRKSKEHIHLYLQDVVQLVADICVFLVVVDFWVVGDECVL